MKRIQDFVFLPPDQLAEVLAAPPDTARDLLVGGVVDQPGGLLLVVRANLESLTVPLAMFRPSGRSRPDFGRLALDDYGRTLQFGDYEATADLVLYEFDPDYRRRVAARRRAEEQGFGPALRRLRSQRGLSRGDFSGLSAKTIARIERGEVDRPHGRTLTLIAGRLGVRPEDVETY